LYAAEIVRKMIIRILRMCTFFLLVSIMLAYYGDLDNPVKVPAKYLASSAAVGDKTYIFGGQFTEPVLGAMHAYDILTLGFALHLF
jgi:hypothetical protein